MLQELKAATLMGGAAIEKLDHELAKVFANIVDPNTKAQAVRQVTLVIKIKPNDKRDRIEVAAQAVSKLSPDEPTTVEALVEQARDGSVAVLEMFRSQDPGRTVLPGCEGPILNVNPFDARKESTHA